MYGPVRQIFAACIGALGLTSTGMWLGWSSVFLRKQRNGQTPYKVTREERNWIGTVMDFGNIISVLPSLYITETKGLKANLMVSAILFELSWLTVIFANGPILVGIARLFAGMAKGTAFTSAPIYMNEIGEVNIRGFLGSLFTVMLFSGTLVEYLFGYIFSYELNNYVNAVIPIIFFFLLFPIPESPYRHLISGDRFKAMKSLYWFRECSRSDPIAKKTYVRAEFSEMEDNVQRDQEAYRKGGWLDLVRTSATRKATNINVALNIFQRASGMSPTLAFSSTTLPPIGNWRGSTFFLFMILFGLSMLLGAITSALLVDRVGRKLPIIIGSSTMSLMMAINSWYFYMASQDNHDIADMKWIPYLTQLVFGYCYNLGIGTVVRVLMIEVYPCNLRPKGVAVSNIAAAATSFSINKIFLNIRSKYGVYYMHGFFVFTNFAAAVYTAFYIFETKLKTFNEIQEILHKNIFNVKSGRASEPDLDSKFGGNRSYRQGTSFEEH